MLCLCMLGFVKNVVREWASTNCKKWQVNGSCVCTFGQDIPNSSTALSTERTVVVPWATFDSEEDKVQMCFAFKMKTFSFFFMQI